MKSVEPPSPAPLWQDEFSIHSAEERYVNRRQFAKFLVLTSLGMWVGNLWILVKSWFSQAPTYPEQEIAKIGTLPVGGVRLFRYPTPQDPCLLIRLDPDTFVAYSQKCTHLSCAVYFSSKNQRIECPCHEGYFSAQDGRVIQGPPPRPLPRIGLKRRGDSIVAVNVETEPVQPRSAPL
jgi:Rieske Fe-S protein